LLNDPHRVRFFGLLQLFAFFMVFLVCSCNLVQLFFSWEGVGLVSFLLISFWYSRLVALKAAFKAVFVNKIGDVFLFLGIVLCWFLYGSVDYLVIFLASEYMVVVHKFIFLLLLLCFFVGVCAKSAQIGLHVWLPDAMEGPTPVSALLHAATMVTVGVFFFLRFSLLFSLVFELLVLFLFVGSLTCIFSGVIGLFQYDIKRIVAYSTCSQLGIMIVGCSFLLVSGAFFHLFVHAFFKALLFLGCGVIIHFFIEEQDLRFMGSAVKFIGPVYVCILFGILALVGFPFLSGFYSKDFLVESLFFFFFYDGLFIGLFLCVVSVLTLFYSVRLVWLCFFEFPSAY
jgi:NADH:ubiquinone oxidoreductase subunit 5 (subunit L)/multisubunit Na+/H+ antiporter MnhA subunit